MVRVFRISGTFSLNVNPKIATFACLIFISASINSFTTFSATYLPIPSLIRRPAKTTSGWYPNFGLVIAATLKSKKIEDEKSIIKYTSGAGLVAGGILLTVYTMLAYVGVISSAGNQEAANGGHILLNITNHVFGSFGAEIGRASCRERE